MSLTIGRVTLEEGALRPFEETWSDTGRDVVLTGILFSDPVRSRDRLGGLHDDLLGLPSSLVPVSFGVKSHRNGYYFVRSAKSSLVELGDQNLIQLVWEVALSRQGADNEVDLESRLAGPVNRLNDHSLSGERWHAPSQGHAAYWAGSSTPGEVVRTGAEGAITVYREVPFDANPRWHSLIENYGKGRARILDIGERAGTGVELPPDGWGLNNSLMSVSMVGDDLELFFHDGTAYDPAKAFNLTVNGVALDVPLSVSVLYNEYDRVTIRCLWDRSPNGRIMGDLTLRRGSRFVEVLLKSSVAVTFGVVRVSPEAATAGAGFVRATSNDSDGNRYLIGSLRSFTSDLVAGGISKASVTRFDAIIGAELGGSAAVAGDQAAHLMGQYVGTPSEVVQAVKR